MAQHSNPIELYSMHGTPAGAPKKIVHTMIEGRSWASVCGSLAHCEGGYDFVYIKRMSDNQVVLRLNFKGMK